MNREELELLLQQYNKTTEQYSIRASLSDRPNKSLMLEMIDYKTNNTRHYIHMLSSDKINSVFDLVKETNVGLVYLVQSRERPPMIYNIVGEDYKPMPKHPKDIELDKLIEKNRNNKTLSFNNVDIIVYE